MLDFILKLRKTRFTRFLLAGGINTLFGLVFYSVCIMAGMEVWLALLISRVVGTIFNFFTTGSFVFRELAPRIFPRFVTCHLVVYGVNLLMIDLISNLIYSKILSQCILIFPLALISYFLMNRFVFFQSRNF